MPRPVDAHAPAPPPRVVCPCRRPAVQGRYCVRCAGLWARRDWTTLGTLWPAWAAALGWARAYLREGGV